MKRLMKWMLPLLLVALLIGSLVWYMFVYDRATVQDFLIAQARNCAEAGNFDAAAWFYDLSYQFAGNDADVAIELSEIYRDVGNYTKAEAALTKSIAEQPSAGLYIALCQTYVAQDKLLDAVNMLDSVSDPAIRAELESQRPAAPTSDHEAGYYSQYITLSFSAPGGMLYVSCDGQYPSLEDEPCDGTLTLSGGDTKIYALTVAENGLVSSLTILNYTVAGVIEPVTLNDSAIEAALRDTLGLSDSATIYTNDLWNVTAFTVPEDARDLSDLRYLTFLQELTVTGIRVEDLSFLSAMSQLRALTLRDCRVSADLTPVGSLQTLQELTMTNCGLSSITGLENAVNLRKLDLSSNAIGKITALAGMTVLERLDLSSNAVKDLSALSAMSQLKWLDVSNNGITSTSALAGCTALTELYISHNALTDVSGLNHAVNLSILCASYNDLTDVSALTECLALTHLELAHNSLTKLTGFGALVDLATLDICHNQITALPKFSADCALVTLKADYNELKKIAVLGGLKNLNQVHLDYNQITDLSPLTKCTNLIQVNIYGNAVAQSDVNKLLNMSVIVNYDPTVTT